MKTLAVHMGLLGIGMLLLGAIVTAAPNVSRANGIITNIWMDGSQLDLMRQNDMRYLSVDVGGTAANGSITTPRAQIASFVSRIKAYENRTGYDFVLLAYSETITTNGYDITNPTYQANYVNGYAEMQRMGFDGVLLDIECIRNAQEQTAYLSILDQMRAKLGSDGFVTAYAGGLIEQPNGNCWAWDRAFYVKAAAKLDLIAAQGFDTGTTSTTDYQNRIKEQVQILSTLNSTTPMILGVPTHKAAPETIGNALSSFAAAVQATPNHKFIGTDVFATWTIDSAEWSTVSSYLGSAPLNNLTAPGCKTATPTSNQGGSTLCQYASGATSDSQQATYQAAYATGAPNADGQCTTSAGGVSWAPANWNIAATLNVTFTTPVYAKNLTVFGDQGMSWASIWVRNDATGQMVQVSGPSTACVHTQSIAPLGFMTSKVMLVKSATDWSVTDAVQLCGTPAQTLDTAAPTILNVTASSVKNTSAAVSWTTSEAANATLRYGTTPALGAQQQVSALALSRSFVLTGLASGTTYYYNVTSCDAARNCATAGPFSFRTNATPATSPTSGTTLCQYASSGSATSSNAGSEPIYAAGAPNADRECSVWSGRQKSWNPASWNVKANLTLRYTTPINATNLTVFGDYDMCWSRMWVRNSATGQTQQVLSATTNACNPSLNAAAGFRVDTVILETCGNSWSSTDAVQLCGRT